MPPSLRLLFAGFGVVLIAAGCGGGDPKQDIIAPAGGGSIAVQVAGLPSGANARVVVTGPTGTATTITASRVLSGLAAGNYNVSAGYVNASNQTFTGQVSASTVTVVLDDTAGVSVTYTGGPPPSLDLRISGTQLIQSTQRSDGSIPMIGHRDAMLRVFVTATGGQQAQPAVRVRLFSAGAPVDSITVPAPVSLVPASVDTSSLANSWNVLIPAARVVSGMSYQVVVDPGDLVAETDETDNLWPGSTPQAVAVQNVPTFALQFVPVKHSANNTTGQVNSGNSAAFAETTKRMHPLGNVTVGLHPVFVTSAPALVSDDANGGWSQILGEVYALRGADGSVADYVGIVPTSYSSGIAGLGYVGAPAAISWDKAASAPGVIAHELGHNFGRSHAPCGNPGGPDPNYPYLNASIGTWGLDLPALTIKAPGTFKDLMSYCNPEWISDYTYLGVLNFRGSSASRAAAQGSAKDGLMIWGRIKNGTVVLEPAFRVHAPIQLPERPGSNKVQGYDAGGRRVFDLSFEGESVADLPHGEERHFAFVVPLNGPEMASLSTMQLTGRGLTVRQARAIPTRTAPGATQGVKRASATELRWDPSYPMAVIRDARTGQIISFARQGVARMPAGTGPVTVQVSEGVSSLPEVRIGTP